MALRKTLIIQEDIDALQIEARAIQEVAKDEERDLTPEEHERFGAIMDADKGELARLDAEMAQAKKYEDAQKRLVARMAREPEAPGTDGASLAIPVAKPRGEIVPRVSYGALKAFKGPDARENAWRSGIQLAASLFGHARAQALCERHGIDIRAVMTEGSNLAGGYLVLPEFEQTVIDLRVEYGVFRNFATLRSMASDVMTIPRRNSGLTAYAVGENVEITASDKGWSQVEVTAKKWGVLSKYSSELAEDAFINLADDLAGEMAYALATKEDNCGFIGDGTSTYHGITGLMNAAAAGSIVTAATGNTAFSTLDYDDLQDCAQALPNFPGIRPAWHVSKAGFYESMDRLAIAGGGSTRTDFEDGPRRQFMGFPVVFNEVTNSTTTAQTSTNILIFGDISLAATMGTRRGLTVSLTTDRYFELDQIGIKGTTRWGISVHENGTASVAGPYIVLATPSS